MLHKKAGSKPVLYVMALYGTLQAAKLFWNDLPAKLTSMGYGINPYDYCVANKLMNKNFGHVDDC